MNNNDSKRNTKLLALSIGLAFSPFALSADNAEDSENTEEVLILGSQEDIHNLSGSAHSLDKTELESFEYTDIGQVLGSVPGVYIRQEDGYGLRPNIGIRAVTGDRSQKINILEDGILITPAPYSAPAAYYVPNVNRMAGVEVFKGPAAILYGPNTIGGSVNLATPAAPKDGMHIEADLAYGTDDFNKQRFAFADGDNAFGYHLEVFRMASDGFKELDFGGDTGFEKTDFNTKFRFQLNEQHELIIKTGYAEEDSDETYLGLSDDDFSQDPTRRYLASAEDHFTSEHTQLHAIHNWQVSDVLEISNKAYINRFERAWKKLDAVGVGSTQLEIKDIFKYADSSSVYANALSLIKGERNSNGSDIDTLDITENARDYLSQGLETRATYFLSSANIEQEISAGLRYHYDEIERKHKQFGYIVSNQNLINDGIDHGYKSLNKGETTAIALFVNDEISVDQWIINAGLRFEQYDGKYTNKLNVNTDTDRSDSIVLPGLGVVYQVNEQWNVIAGVNKGFSPNGPAASDDIDPEESINYEYGLKYLDDNLQAELIGFFSDYSNLIGRCGVSDTGCSVGDEFNGGSVEVSGLEALMNYQHELEGFTIPLELSYTYTESAFQENFEVNFGQWGKVNKGDELPYLPEHQLRFTTGLKAENWDLLATIKYISEMRDQPGQQSFKDEYAQNGEQYTQALTTLDLSASYYIDDNWTTQLVLENITDETEAVSYKPFGARPNKPRAAVATIKYRF